VDIPEQRVLFDNGEYYNALESAGVVDERVHIEF
jgi:hypothetical protein